MRRRKGGVKWHRLFVVIIVVAMAMVMGVLAKVDAAPDIEMVFVKGGCFQMGDTFGDGGNDEKPVHEVCINDFYIGRYVVTQGQWQSVMVNNPSKFKGDRRPVENVSWDDTQQFIAKLNLQAGRRYRLPTEAEWEYTARSGGKREEWPGTSNLQDLGDYAWYSNNLGETHPVGEKKPNGLGIYDMSGNVWEWCQDWYNYVYYKESPRDNPQGPGSDTFRVLRGGSWGNNHLTVRASDRYGDTPWHRDSSIGFRVVLPAQ